MSFRPCRFITASLLIALVVSACGREEARSMTCRTHKVSNGELTECS
jgi:Fe-S-cluster containining protein